MKSIADAADAISQGQIIPAVKIVSRDELSDMAHSFDGLVAYLSKTVAVTQEIAAGNLEIDVSPAGEHDALGHALVRMTDSLRAVQHDLRASEANLRTVARLAHGLPNYDNPRQAICEAAREIAGAEIAQLWEPRGHAHLVATAASGAEVTADMRVALDGETSGTAMAYRSRQRLVVYDVHARGAPVSARVREILGAASALYEPVIGHEDTLGVLVVTWTTAISSTNRARYRCRWPARCRGRGRDRTCRHDGAAEADGEPGRAHRLGQPPRLGRRVPARAAPGAPRRPARLRRDHRPRPLQGVQRSQWPPSRRPVTRGGCHAWRAGLRDSDLLARYGGEEFAIVLPGTTLPTATEVLDRLRASTPDGQACSIGLAQWDCMETADELLARADAQVYRAKAAGRNRTMHAGTPQPAVA